MTALKQVLAYFENPGQGESINKIARDLHLSPGQVKNMVEFWVKKGRLRSVVGDYSNCGGCATQDGCPTIIKLPQRYELAIEGENTGLPCERDR